MKPIDLSKPIVTAHRGASGLVAHENTIEAFEKAIELKVDSIECDVRKTKDNIIIVNHNEDIEGLIIRDHTYFEICEATSKNGYIQPTLKEALECVKGKILIDIEIKEDGYEEELIKQITEILSIDEFYIRGFSDKAVKKVKQINPQITTVLLVGREHVKLGYISRIFNEVYCYHRVRKTKCNFVSPNYQLLILNFCKRMHKKNVKVFAWTVNEKELMESVLTKGVDGLITNYPDVALKVLNR